MITNKVPVEGIGTYTITLHEDGVIVEMSNSTIVTMIPVFVSWDEMPDMEILYEKLKELRVKAFKPIVEALGNMYRKRSLYEELMR